MDLATPRWCRVWEPRRSSSSEEEEVVVLDADGELWSEVAAGGVVGSGDDCVRRLRGVRWVGGSAESSRKVGIGGAAGRCD